ncbi:S-adenosyl-L-methionine-dependent methyltransferase [Lentithecium fluviatile CBS 122367]|uniref:S-adenosyl-L-methionine-dependent methyltransferase n=1 Tax=Lentithecium fluviatile CBS 122367 TaxID=1168545 RepID=A0A6G1IRU2_9PLEO|nr:S-adenosyl-L-methionine-dependent methyltransferase [Lentithecium fluviatile CBS 122367]
MWRTNPNSPKDPLLPSSLPNPETTTLLPHAPTVENKIAMKSGCGAYAAISSMQQEAQRWTYPLFPSLSSQRHVMIVDYGCGPASPSIDALKALLSMLPDGSAASILLNDRVYNNWSGVATAAKRAEEELGRELDGRVRVYTSLVPQSFYTQILLEGSVDIGLSWSSFNYLEHQPIPIPVSGSSWPDAVRRREERNIAQAHIDCVKLLELRAVETKPGGCLVMALSASPSPGKMQLAVLDPGMHERSEEEVQRALSDTVISKTWDMTICKPEVLVHPAWDVLQVSPKSEEDYEEYGERCARWIFAVLGWYAVRALRVEEMEEERGLQKPMTEGKRGFWRGCGSWRRGGSLGRS